MYLETENSPKFQIKQTNQKMGVIVSIFLFLINIYFYYQLKRISVLLMTCALLSIFFTIFFPRLFKAINFIFSKFIVFIAYIISFLSMIILYFIVLFPLSLISKLINKQKKVNTYWIKDEKKTINFDLEY